jgi:hypothetical protein
MKPDWQNKSYAKTSSPTAPSTMHSKLKVGMTSLHSKIAVSNHNMPSQPKPAVRKFADGGAVMTRSDDEIGDTNPRTGKVDPGSYDRRMAEGAKNMERLRSAADSIKSFFSGEDKSSSDKSSSDNITNNDGANESDKAKREIISAAMTPKSETSTAMTETKTEPPSYMKGVRETLMKPKAESTMTMPAEEAKAPKVSKSPKAPSEPVAEVKTKPIKPVGKSARLSPMGQSAKDIEAMVEEKKRQKDIQRNSPDTGDEAKRLRDRTSKSIPGVVGRFDLQGNQIPVGLGPRSSQVYSGDGSTAMSRAENRYLQSRIDAGNLTAMERAQAKRAGLI